MLYALTALFAVGNARIVGESLEDIALSTPRSNWVEVGPAKPSALVKLMAVLKRDPKNLQKLEDKFWAVSNPKSSDYGNHLSQDEVTRLIGIEDDHVNAVVDFFKDQGATIDVGAHLDIVEVSMPVKLAEEIFDTKLYHFRHKKKKTNNVIRSRTGVGHKIPDKMKNKLVLVDNLEGFPAARINPTKDLKSEDDAAETDMSFPQQYDCNGHCYDAVTPGVIRDRYKISAPNTGNAKGRMAVAEFQGVDWSQTQLDYFNEACGTDATVDTQYGEQNDPEECNSDSSGQDCTEALLDIEYIRGVAGKIPLTDVYSDGYSLYDWAKTVQDMSDATIPQVNSVSYGNDEVQQSSNQYMENCNVEFMKLGTRGISVLFAAGDQGVWGRTGVGSQYHPDFPAGSPYVTAVGGTNFAQAGVIGEEEAWDNGGGGFSNVFAIPDYQKSFVAAYKKQPGLPSQSYWNANGRGYPDVSALAGLRNPYCVVADNRYTGVGGTSASTPVVSAMIAKLNEIRYKNGKSSLGFLNPWLYQNADAFNDVTLGRNGGDVSSAGFPATVGWDASTGLGTPNYEMLSTRV